MGRITSHLAETAAEVVACDFIEKLTAGNKGDNGHFENITFITEDTTKLEFGPDAFDLVFSNWLLMYMTEVEVEAFLNNAISWVCFVVV